MGRLGVPAESGDLPYAQLRVRPAAPTLADLSDIRRAAADFDGSKPLGNQEVQLPFSRNGKLRGDGILKTVIQLENLSKAFGEDLVLKQVNREFEEGKIHGIVGLSLIHICEGELSENENRRYLIQVNRIEQELVRIKVPDNEKEFYLVPAWNFYGTINGQEAEEEGGITSLDSPLLTLNAVDGTVINTYLGY